MTEEEAEAIAYSMTALREWRWVAWIAALASLMWAGYELGKLPGLCVGFGFCAVAFAVSNEIRAAIYPIGMVAIHQLGKDASPQSE